MINKLKMREKMYKSYKKKMANASMDNKNMSVK